ncbi:hypothetical protein [Spartinivicinus poritis]|uniref:Uncharacterized protein n=1 Tax=Spartinivicinus poritis TaxID=2994640 RepID=A0ABT5UI62_9GAMM|nr:hypothetical protein [Spartinivicinus sp. A2-2]MDE1465992.1 hypothetical protein [Spartinivicinus sp. A2-2]
MINILKKVLIPLSTTSVLFISSAVLADEEVSVNKLNTNASGFESSEYCKDGQSLIDLKTVAKNISGYCNLIDKTDRWAIVRLAGEASISGSGYGCEIKLIDSRNLGHGLCGVPKQQKKVEGETCPSKMKHVSFEDVSQNLKEVCESLGEWDIVRIGNRGSVTGSGYGCSLKVNDSKNLGHSLCMDE